MVLERVIAMSDLIEDLYTAIEETLRPDFFRDPEYLRLKKTTAQLWEEIAAALGPDGKTRLEALRDAEYDEKHFWHLAMFRHILALGLELGRLPFSLTVSAPRRCGTE